VLSPAEVYRRLPEADGCPQAYLAISVMFETSETLTLAHAFKVLTSSGLSRSSPQTQHGVLDARACYRLKKFSGRCDARARALIDSVLLNSVLSRACGTGGPYACAYESGSRALPRGRNTVLGGFRRL